VAEVFRSGIESIHESQRAAAASLGLSDQDTMRFVVLPQAIRNVMPANMNLFIALQKDVALLSFIGPVEIFRQAGVYKSLFANFTPYVGAALIFLAITIPATRYADYLLHRQTRRRTVTAQPGAKLSLRGVQKSFGRTMSVGASTWMSLTAKWSA
jgi:polar amino acid transport system permease protein